MKNKLLKHKIDNTLVKLKKTLNNKGLFQNQNYQKDNINNYNILTNEEIELLQINNKYSLSEIFNKKKELSKFNLTYPILVKSMAFDSEPYFFCYEIKKEKLKNDPEIELDMFYDKNNKKLPTPQSYILVSKEELDYFKS